MLKLLKLNKMTFKKGNIPWNKGLTKWTDERKLQKKKEKKKEYSREYEQRPEVKARRKEYRREYNQLPERKLKNKKWRENNTDYYREYYQRPEVKSKRKEYYQEYYEDNLDEITKQHKEWYENNKDKRKEYMQRPERKAKKKEYSQRSEVKAKQNTHNRKRRKEDSKYAICRRVRENFKDALKLYSTTGKVMSTSKYLDMDAIIKHLTPFPEPRENYHIDHIIPLCKFNHDDPEQVRKAWLPSNLQWLPKEINLWKGDRLILPMTKEQQDKLLKRLKKEQKS